MLEPFIWMFKAENFKKHLLYLLAMFGGFFALALIASLAGYFLPHLSIQSFLCSSIAIFFFIAPFLCFQGYFWELTANIISRDTDIKASNVYNGKIKEVFKIELPELNTFKFIWRGFASIVATLLMFLPFVMLAGTTFFTGVFLIPMVNIDAFASTYLVSYLFIYLFLCSFIPALLWNYAKQDSVVAVWNIRKAIFIMGNYTGKYIWNTLLFIVFYIINYAVIAGIGFLLGVYSNLSMDVSAVIRIVLFYILSTGIYFYALYVYAYLLGTIAPSAEG